MSTFDRMLNLTLIHNYFMKLFSFIFNTLVFFVSTIFVNNLKF